MHRPTTHRWLPFYFWILFCGIGAAILPIFRALNLPGSGGFIFLGVLLIAIRAVTCWGLFTRNLWGWYLNFGALFAIPVLKVITVLSFSGNYDENTAGPGSAAIAILWLIYAVPNAVYFKKRKYLFDDGQGPYKTLFDGCFGRVLDPQSGPRFTASNAPSPGQAVEVTPIIFGRAPVVENVTADIPFEIEECVLFDNEMEEEMAAINLSDKFDEQFYEIAQKEFDAGDIAKGLMLKAEVAAGGDAGKARLLYIKTRAQKLAGEEKSLAGLREALAGAVKNEKSAEMFLKRIQQFRADYPDNSKIDELQAELEYQRLEERIAKKTEHYAPIQRCKKHVEMCECFLAMHPEHLKRREIEQHKAMYVFPTTQIDAQQLIIMHKYQEASDLYKKYLEQYSEHADKARKMIDETIPKLIADEPARKRRVKRNCVLGAAILAGLVVIIGFFVVRSVYKSNSRFTINIKGFDVTVKDNLTRLEWVQAPHLLSENSRRMDWVSADDFCNNLVYAGYYDWRLPSENELLSVKKSALPIGHPFDGLKYDDYWSDTSGADYTGRVWCPVNMDYGYDAYGDKTYGRHVWPVRGGQ